VRELSLTALAGFPEVAPGASLPDLVLDSLARSGKTLDPGDVLVVAQKIVSKAEGRRVRLADVQPSERARALAVQAQKDPRLIELILREAREVLRVKPGIVIVEHRLGFVMANAGIDQSNLAPGETESALLLPQDPDASAARLRAALAAACGVEVGVIVNDSFGRAWRNGVTGVAIGVAGVPALIDLRGRTDRVGRELRVTEIAAADELAAAASLVMGQADEGFPVVHARGFPYALRAGSAVELVRPRAQDLFR
jgi:coenzyme F420-0:L-glutamate ligase / coenzyme F420-1:gamma-L-glutamate ligase